MDKPEVAYLKRRAFEEMELAETSSDPIASRIHRRLSILYSNKCAAETNRPVLHIVSPSVAA